jgi:alkaline phosphatase D
MKKTLFILIVLSIFISSCNQQTQKNTQPYLVILSMDGFRWDYTDSVATPNFDAMAKRGVKAESMQVSFPSKTFPNHYTLATGLVPNHHGIVNNTFYAPKYDEVYSISKREMVQDGKFYGGEPIWNTAEKQGVKAASYFWVGSEADIQGMHPSIWKLYDQKIDFYQRADSVIAWLNLPNEKRPHMILWYVHEPDHSGHRYGPHSIQTDSVVKNLDELLGYFMKKLDAQAVGKQVNFILTADHGMENISKDRVVYLDDVLPKKWYDYCLGSNPIYNIKAHEKYKDSIQLVLNQIKGIKCYENPNLPDYLNYGDNPRCLDFTIVADSAFSLIKSRRKHFGGGTHGYDIHNKNMNAIFYAYGPAFKQGYAQPMFKNVDVYPLMCQILGLVPAPNDGDFKEVSGMLK